MHNQFLKKRSLGIAQKGPVTPLMLHVCFSTWVEELVTRRGRKKNLDDVKHTYAYSLTHILN